MLIIAPPVRVGLAYAAVGDGPAGLGATNGVLVTSAKALEQARRIGTVVFGQDRHHHARRGGPAADWDKPSYEQDTVRKASREAIAALAHAASAR